MPVAKRLRSVALNGAAFALAALLSVPMASAQVDRNLLPAEEAFRFAARALDTRTLEANFMIANGYYLYRDKISFSIEPQDAGRVSTALPPGKLKDDEFFGKVETYRDRLVVRLPVDGAVPGQSITLRADSQGCADIGVCYPPNTQRITLALPAKDAAPGPLIEATPAKKRWFN